MTDQLPTYVDPEDIADILARYKVEGAARRTYFANHEARVGLVPSRVIRPTEGVVESTADPRFMERVCLALADHFVVSDKTAPSGRRTATYAEKLAKAGCTPEQYLQIKDDPQFLPMLGHIATAIHLIPRLPGIIGAQAAKAEDGDTKAAEMALRLTRIMDPASADDVRAEFANLTEEAWVAMMDAELTAAKARLMSYTQAPREITDEEMQAASDARPKPPPETPRLDHGKIHPE